MKEPTSTIYQHHGFPLRRMVELARARARDMAAPVLIEMESGERYIVDSDGSVVFA